MKKPTMIRFSITTPSKSISQINKEVQKEIKRVFGKEIPIKVRACYIEPEQTMMDYGHFVFNSKKWNIQIGNYRKERNIKRYNGIVLLWRDFK